MNALVKFSMSLAMVAVAMSAASQAHAAPIYNPNAAFFAEENGTQSNPFGPFTVGDTTGLGGAFTAFAGHSNTYASNNNLGGYFDATAGFNSLPVALINTSAGPITTNFSVTLASQEILLHPNVNGSTQLYADVQFTAPISAPYLLAGFFQKLNNQGNGEDVHVLVNGTSVFDSILSPFPANQTGTPATFNLTTIALTAGSKIDFVVGPNGTDFGSDSVGFAATLTAVPEPGSMILFGVGAVGLFVVARRHRKA